MIVVLGSSHDPVAKRLASFWPDAALCSAEDLTAPGWTWSSASPESNRWVVNGRIVQDRDISGVFVRRSCVYAEELLGTHPGDREYLAAESTAFLTSVLASAHGTVVNPVVDGGFGEAALRPERWISAAAALGIRVAKLGLSSTRPSATPPVKATIEVAGRATFGKAPKTLHAAAAGLAQALGVSYATFVFGARARLLGVRALKPPSDDACRALVPLLTVA